jgi:hypothetical protein
VKGAKNTFTAAEPNMPRVPKAKAQLEKTKAAKSALEGLAARPIPSVADISTLPEFARMTWSTRFLPTLYDCLGCSREPFVICVNIIKPVQEVVDATYPGSGYRVIANDRLITMVSYINIYLSVRQLTGMYAGERSPQ